MPEYLPNYASAPLRRFLVSWESDFCLLHLSMRGISVLSGRPRVFEALIPGAEVEEQEKLSTDLREARREAELAENELRMGFPLLHAHALVAMWSALEAAIEDMLVGILLNEPDVLRKTCSRNCVSPSQNLNLKTRKRELAFCLRRLAEPSAGETAWMRLNVFLPSSTYRER